MALGDLLIALIRWEVRCYFWLMILVIVISSNAKFIRLILLAAAALVLKLIRLRGCPGFALRHHYRQLTGVKLPAKARADSASAFDRSTTCAGMADSKAWRILRHAGDCLLFEKVMKMAKSTR